MSASKNLHCNGGAEGKELQYVVRRGDGAGKLARQEGRVQGRQRPGEAGRGEEGPRAALTLGPAVGQS